MNIHDRTSGVVTGALALAFLFPVASFAQQATPAASPSGQWGHGHHNGLPGLRGIDLSDQQKAQIKTMTDQYRAAHPDGSPPDPAAHKALEDQVMTVLTPDQQAQYKANVAKMRQYRDQNGPPQPSPSPA
jgi:Spy/CpxP family protein refolding chaperone